jgi:glycosyltransferase involved in cell wall biosynthesis
MIPPSDMSPRGDAAPLGEPAPTSSIPTPGRERVPSRERIRAPDDTLAAPLLRKELAPLDLTVLMPCLNEAETLAICIRKARASLITMGVRGEVLVADNGSTDGSQQVARMAGARVLDIATKGYGAALRGGIDAAGGRHVVMGDADDSYDFSRLELFYEKLEEGYDLVMGNRFAGGIGRGAMPPLHRYLGNPVLTTIGRLFFRSPCGDFHCGLRGFNRAAIQRLDLRTEGMEFASEMIVKATIQRLRITEVPTTLRKDGRHRPPHLRSWRDGWRHLRFLLLFSPRFLFFYPGLLLFGIGLAAMAWLIPRPRSVDGVVLDVHTLLFAAAAMLLGAQCVAFWAFSKVFAISEGLLPSDPRLRRALDVFTLETGLVLGGVAFAAGFALSWRALSMWSGTSFGALNPSVTLRLAIPGVTLMVLGLQGVLSSFFLSVLSLRRR